MPSWHSASILQYTRAGGAGKQRRAKKSKAVAHQEELAAATPSRTKPKIRDIVVINPKIADDLNNFFELAPLLLSLTNNFSHYCTLLNILFSSEAH